MKSESYDNFWQRIHNSAGKKGLPLRVMFELTYRCNFKCKHCYVPQSYRKKDDELKTQEVFLILEQLKDIGCFYLGFTGGEPFMRKDILEILWYAKRLGFEIIIYTNSSLINKKIADKLSSLRLNKVDITIPSITKGTFEGITQVSGSHKKVFSAIELLRERGVKLGFKTCVLKKNEDKIEDIQRFVARLDAFHRIDDMLMPTLNRSREPYKYRGAPMLLSSSSSLDKNCGLTKELRQTLVENRSPIPESQKSRINKLFKCGVGEIQAAITPFGELKMCLMIDYPKYRILEISLKDCWQRLKELVSSIEPDGNYKCDKCELRDCCKWCPAKAWLYNGTFTSCEPESRSFAEIRKELLIC